MPLTTYTLSEKIIDKDDQYAQASSAGPTTTTILNFNAKAGKIARIVGYRNAVDAAGISTTTFQLFVNGAQIPDYGSNPNQWGSPEQDVYLPVPVDVPMGSNIQVRAVNSSSTTYNVTARLIVVYFDPPGFGEL